jgi:hypothetical protein
MNLAERVFKNVHLEGIIVWGVWGLMTAAGLVYLQQYGCDIPRADDWYLVTELASGQRLTLNWLWAPVADHRLPLQKLIVWVLWNSTGGSIKEGLFLGFIPLALTVAALIVAAHRIRGKISFFDAFFPLYLLHLGHAPIFLWWTTIGVPWNVALTCLIMAALIFERWHSSWSHFALIQIGIVLLILNGSTGFLYSIPLLLALLTSFALWYRRLALRHLVLLAIGVAIIVTLQALYLAGVANLKFQEETRFSLPRFIGTFAEFLGMAVGPVVARRTWPISGIFVFTFIAASVVALLCQKNVNAIKRISYFCLILSPVALALGVALGRHYQGGLLDRYAMYVSPLLVCLYLLWVRFADKRLSNFTAFCLFVLACSMAGFNFSNGLAFGKTLLGNAHALSSDIRRGATPMELVATRSRDWCNREQVFEDGLRALQRAKVSPFDNIPANPPFEKIQIFEEPTVAWNCIRTREGWQTQGPGSSLRFLCSESYHVYVIRITFLLKSSGSSAKMRIMWIGRQNGPLHQMVKTAETTFWFNTAKPRRVETVSFWVDDCLQYFDFYPNTSASEIDIKEVTLLVRQGNK